MTSQSDRNLTIERMPSSTSSKNKDSKTQGFFAQSTAPINVEDQPTPQNQTFDDIKADAIQVLLESTDPQINIYVHGYSVKHEQAKARAQALFQTAQDSHDHPGQLVFGFLWPSENPIQDNGQITQNPNIKWPRSLIQKIGAAFESLPTVLLIALFLSLIVGLTSWGLLLLPNIAFSLVTATVLAVLVVILSMSLLAISKALYLFPLAIVHVLSSLGIFWISQFSVGHVVTLLLADVMPLLFGMIFTLIILRLVTYLRDRERASYFAVYDLVELIRKLDKAIAEQGRQQDQQQGIPEREWKSETELNNGSVGRPRVELNIMAHSLGCMVVTNAIRILSDVFDPDAIAKTPNPKLGQTLSLQRLVLVAPDIPIEAVLPGRSNFLTSTLGRCCEPYVFTNEGDLALRLASTAANYIGYFSRTRFGGYRLGNITCHRSCPKIQYGIIKLNALNDQYYPHDTLDVRSSNREKETLTQLFENRLKEQQKILSKDQPKKWLYEGIPYHSEESWHQAIWHQDQSDQVDKAIADKITYFDCTDYTDYTNDTVKTGEKRIKPLMTEAKGRTALSFCDYCCLVIKYLVTKQIDTHGGYFDGQLSQELLHALILSGFQEYLENYHNSSLDTFSDLVSQKKIQVVLSKQFSQSFS